MNHNDGHFSRLFYSYLFLGTWRVHRYILTSQCFNGASKIGHVLLCTHQRCDPQHTHQLISSTKTGKVAEVNEGLSRMSRKYVTPFHPYRWTIWNGHELGSTMVCMIYIYIYVFIYLIVYHDFETKQDGIQRSIVLDNWVGNEHRGSSCSFGSMTGVWFGG